MTENIAIYKYQKWNAIQNIKNLKKNEETYPKISLKTNWNEIFKQIPIGIQKLSKIVTDLSDTFIIDKLQHDFSNCKIHKNNNSAIYTPKKLYSIVIQPTDHKLPK